MITFEQCPKYAATYIQFQCVNICDHTVSSWLQFHLQRKYNILIFLSFCLFHFSATDCNPLAAECAMRTANQNQVNVEVVTSELLSALQPQLNGAIDLIMFNPPYVVTPSEEVISRDRLIGGQSESLFQPCLGDMTPKQ